MATSHLNTGRLKWHEIYQDLLFQVLATGNPVSPRGKLIKELMAMSFTIHSCLDTILVSKERDLNYRFMIAEALWIMAGHNDVAPIAKFNSVYAQFSDDGETLAGAYGPKIISQLPHLLRALHNDKDTRQAVITIWERNPKPSKDIPCTLSAQFLIRDNKLHSIWTMRSSDLWLGLPYDVFTFSLIQATLCSQLNWDFETNYDYGSITMQLGSAHIYMEHWEKALAVTNEKDTTSLSFKPPLAWPSKSGIESFLSGNGWDDSFIAHLGHVLQQPTKAKALEVLRAASKSR